MPRLSKIGAAALAAFGWTGLSSVSASYLVVAGGGGGGTNNSAGDGGCGGGGAGGYRTGTEALNPTQSYSVIVGAGGASGAPDAAGSNGSSSVFLTTTSAGGGGGGDSQNGVKRAGDGGSGGGAGYINSAAGSGNTPSTSPSQGNNGGSYSSGDHGAGGGGATAAGSNTAGSPGAGGAGTANSISGSSVTYAGGGGGGGYNTTGASGGSGGGGQGGSNGAAGISGTANLGGGGGGGGGGSAPPTVGGAGGSGVVIISYVGAQQFGGGVVTVSGGNTIHTFTTSGTLSPLNSLTASYLIVAGGGGGGGFNNGGGGGAGGLLSGSGVTIDTNSIYAVTVGAGGIGGSTSTGRGTNGTNSSFSMVSTAAVGGGGGGGFDGGSGGLPGFSGGSGGGGGALNAAGGAGTSGQGFAGGTAASNSAGGGGGSGSVGGNASGSSPNGVGGNGGTGTSSSISGTSTFYASGGGGSAQTSGTQGTASAGGGGNGLASGANANPGTANTGGGGGGMYGGTSGGAGGSGVVIISYPGSTQQMAGGTVTVAGGNVIHTFTSSGYLTPIVLTTNSLRYRSSASAYLNRTPSVASNRKTWTFSAWVKRGTLGSVGTILHCYDGSSSRRSVIQFNSDNTIGWDQGGGGTSGLIDTVAVYRDPSAWYHLVCVADYSNGTAANRALIYINGVLQAVTTADDFDNADGLINSTNSHQIGSQGGSSNFFDGYMDEINFIDGQALTPNSFGTFNGLGVWQPIRYGGSYGTNGFYLPFSNNNIPAALGYDSSPNGNNWTPNNFSLARSYTTYTSGSGTYTVPTGVTSIQYLVVGGGGGGGGATSGASNGGSGGGAGGMLYGTMSVTPGQTISYSVGAGGSGGTTSGGAAGAGSNSTFGTLTAVGGGYGIQSGGAATGGSGGSGGGSAGAGTVGSGTAGQGNNGGVGGSSATGGGGGAGAKGGNSPTTSDGGAGGAGITWINGTTYAGGGGGGGYNSAGAGGAGGGGAGGNSGTAGTANTGGGGGGANGNIGASTGGAGGSGIIIIATGSASTYDSMTDVPTLTSATTANYCVWSPINKSSTQNVTNGNLTASSSGGTSYGALCATMGVTSGKWYWEMTYTRNGSTNSPVIGFGNDLFNYTNPPGGYLGSDLNAGGINVFNGNAAINGTSTAYGSAIASNDVVMFAMDLDNRKFYVGKNGTWFNSGNPVAGTNQWPYSATIVGSTFFPAVNMFNDSAATNFGQQPWIYTPPTGFVALNTFNLPTPTIGATASTTANKYFNVVTYTGASTGVSVDVGFNPDFTWMKNRSNAYDPWLYDTNRTYSNQLLSNSASAAGSSPLTRITNGFLTDPSTGSQGLNGQTYVAWNWYANGGTTVTNTQGSITSTVQANTAAGFSVVTYTGNSTAGATIGHGLGVAPSMIITKTRNTALGNWGVYNASIGATNALNLNTTIAAATFIQFWNNTAPTSTVFSVGTSNDVNGASTYVAYCFAPVAGYSAFGSYTGNGSNDGPFIYLGFRPRFVMIKRTDSTGNWIMFDSARGTYNVNGPYLYANSSSAEGTSTTIGLDFLSNGFKNRNTYNDSNTSSGTYIYMAFAESPFKYANAE